MSTSSPTPAALPYHEPPILLILIQSSFLILLNTLNYLLDRFLYCGLVGQILVGIAWGVPGAKLLPSNFEHAVVQLGYLGLLLLVYEGGLATSFPSLRANIHLSVAVAATGIAAPMGLSFVLGSLMGATPIQCFAAGAALCSTSLGTTFAVLRASGLAPTRLGVVLASAAMLDDVVGLVMVQVISNLSGSGGGSESISAVVIVRPVLVSLGFAVVAALVCWLIVRPVTGLLNGWRSRRHGQDVLGREQTALMIHTALLVGLIAAAAYAGTSTLLAAYISGATISWWDSEVPHVAAPTAASTTADEVGSGNETSSRRAGDAQSSEQGETSLSSEPRPSHGEVNQPPVTTGHEIFAHYYAPAVKWVLQPFFFASIGFSIPITRMFYGPVVWKGIVYAILMMVGKLVCGLWLVRMPNLTTQMRAALKNYVLNKDKPAVSGASEATRHDVPSGIQQQAVEPSADSPTEPKTTRETQAPSITPSSHPHAAPSPSNPVSLYPAAILGLAMVPRGEIGFLISSLAQSNGTFGRGDTGDESAIFLVVTWAIFLCTIVGPFCVGMLVRRVKRLELESNGNAGSRRDVLGVWGVS